MATAKRSGRKLDGTPLVYTNVVLNTVDGVSDEPLSTYVARSGVLVESAEDYYVSLTRFSVPFQNMPVLDAQMAPGSTTQTRYNVTAAYFDSAGPTTYYGGFIPLFLQTTAPVGQFDSTFVYSVLEVVNMLNVAAKDAWTSLQAVAIPGNPLLGISPPSFAVTQASQLQYVLPRYDIFDTNRLTHAFLIFSRETRILLQGFNLSYLPIAIRTNTRYFKLNAECTGTNYKGSPETTGQTPPLTNAPFVVTSLSDYPSYSLGVISLQFQSDLPTAQEFIGGVLTPHGIAQLPILFNFSMSDIQANISQSTGVYNASGLGGSRWAKLVGKAPVSSFTISVSAVTAKGTVFPVTAVSVAECKLCFAHRNLVEMYPAE